MWRRVLTSALLGFAVPVFAVFLMVFKGGLHAHGFPDFLPAQILAVLRSAPWFALGGALAALFAKRFAALP